MGNCPQILAELVEKTPPLSGVPNFEFSSVLKTRKLKIATLEFVGVKEIESVASNNKTK